VIRDGHLSFQEAPPRTVKVKGASTPSNPKPVTTRAPRPAIRFLVRFTTAWVLGLIVLSLFPAVEGWAVEDTLRNLGVVLRVLRMEVRVFPPFIQAEDLFVEIVPDCTPLLPTLALVAAIAAFPARFRWKVCGILTGTVVLWVFNLVRLLAMMRLLAWLPEFAPFAHLFLLQTITLLVVFGLFSFWLYLQGRVKRSP
jgi:exosortase/archaeosortase family protein